MTPPPWETGPGETGLAEDQAGGSGSGYDRPWGGGKASSLPGQQEEQVPHTPDSAPPGPWDEALAAHAGHPWTIRDFHRVRIPVGEMLRRLRQIPPGQPKVWSDGEVRRALAGIPTGRNTAGPPAGMKSRRALLRRNLRRRTTGRHYFRDPGRLREAERIVAAVERGKPVSSRWLAQRLGCSPQTALTVLQELRKRGMVRLHQTPGGMHKYIRK